MFRLNIHSKIHGECFKEFETLELAQFELENLRASKHFGVEGYVEIIPATDEMPEETIEHEGSVSYEIVDLTAQAAQEKTNKESLKFLADTDWYVTRFMETGVTIPADISDARQAARLRIVK